MELGLKGKVALVTGASEGIGREIAWGLARLGMRVVACGRNEVRLAELETSIEAAGGECFRLSG